MQRVTERALRDRRDLASLGLTVLLYGLVVAPVLHVLEDHEGALELPAAAQGWVNHRAPSEPGHRHEPWHAHDHGHPHHHPAGSVEHLRAVALTHAPVQAPVVWWVPLRAEEPSVPERVAVAPLRLTAMPQGP